MKDGSTKKTIELPCWTNSVLDPLNDFIAASSKASSKPGWAGSLNGWLDTISTSPKTPFEVLQKSQESLRSVAAHLLSIQKDLESLESVFSTKVDKPLLAHKRGLRAQKSLQVSLRKPIAKSKKRRK